MGRAEPPPLPPDERLRWAELRDELPFTALAPLRDTAEKWGASIAALLGIFGTVAFVKGPEALSDVPAEHRLWVTVAIILAGTAAGIAVLLAALAAQGSPTWQRNLSPELLAARTKRAQRSAVWQIAWSRYLALAAAALLFASTAGLWLIDVVGADSAAGADVLVISQDGSVLCGELIGGGDDPQIETATGNVSALERVAQIAEVASCPSE